MKCNGFSNDKLKKENFKLKPEKDSAVITMISNMRHKVNVKLLQFDVNY